MSDNLVAIRVDKTAPKPAYLQIAEGIKALVLAGTLAPGTALPPERVLSKAFGVSRMTLREAYDLMERDELIAAQRGRGTFVLPHRMQKQQQEMRSFTEEILARGGVPTSKVLYIHTVKPGGAARDFFSLAPEELVYEMQRVRFSDKVPIALETVQIPCRLCPNLDRFDLANQSLYKILEEDYRFRLARCLEEISAEQPSRALKKILHAPQSAAVLVIRRRTYTGDDTPLEWGVTVYRGDLYSAMVHSVRAQKVAGNDCVKSLSKSNS